MRSFTDKLKQAWEENPVLVIGVAAAAVTAVAKLMEANTNRQNQKVWQREVDRRIMKSK